MKNFLGKLDPRIEKCLRKKTVTTEAGELTWRKLMTKDILTKDCLDVLPHEFITSNSKT